MTLSQTITEWHEKAADARRLGNVATATAIEECLTDLSKAAEPFTRKLSEERARLYAQRSIRWLRSRFGSWEKQGFAGWDEKGQRWYLLCALPVPMDTDSIIADAERTAAEDTAA